MMLCLLSSCCRICCLVLFPFCGVVVFAGGFASLGFSICSVWTGLWIGGGVWDLEMVGIKVFVGCLVVSCCVVLVSVLTVAVVGFCVVDCFGDGVGFDFDVRAFRWWFGIAWYCSVEVGILVDVTDWVVVMACCFLPWLVRMVLVFFLLPRQWLGAFVSFCVG